MQCYTELTPPTAVSHSINIALLGPKANNLVIARTSLLQIFELKHTGLEEESDNSQVIEPNNGDLKADITDRSYFATDQAFNAHLEPNTKLVLLAEYPLSGTVLSLAKVKPVRTKSKGEALLVAFRDAKFSLVEWNPFTHSLSTISIHFYEGQDNLYPWAGDYAQYHTFLTVDPNNRCAALKFGPRQLAILPFRQIDEDGAADLADLDGDVEMKGTKREGVTPEKSLYHKSFVLPTTALEPSLTHPIHLAFLHEYREPTIAILSAVKAPAASNLYERKDTLVYTVFTLDLEQKASTTIMSVANLPFDLVEIIPLEQPVGGALLVGANELVHVDQSGKTIALAVNEFAKDCSAFPMADQSELGLRLEGCTITSFSENCDMLIVPRSGNLTILSFKLDGRSVAGLQITMVSAENGGNSMSSQSSCASAVGDGCIFVGTEEGDSILLMCKSKGAQKSRKKIIDAMDDDEDLDLDADDIDDDDIYGDSTDTKSKKSTNMNSIDPSEVSFRVVDRLPNYAMAAGITLSGRAFEEVKNESEYSSEALSQVQLVSPCGRGDEGGLAVMHPDILPDILQSTEMPGIRSIWPISIRSTTAEITDGESKVEVKTDLSSQAAYDSYLITTARTDAGGEESMLYSIKGTGFERLQDHGDFGEDVSGTVCVGTMMKNTRVVQIHTTEIRMFNAEFELVQILPIVEDEMAGIKVIAASFCESHIVITKDDATLVILEATGDGELEEVDLPEAITNTKWMSASIYQSQIHTAGAAVLFLLSAEGILKIFDLPKLSEPGFSSAGLSYLPSTFGPDFVVRRAAAKETLVEILVADIGDSISAAPYLVARTSMDDLILYELYHHPPRKPGSSFCNSLRFHKTAQPKSAKFVEDAALEAALSGRQTTLNRVHNLCGYATVFQAGTSPSFVLKESSSLPRVIRLKTKAAIGFAAINILSCERGFAFIDAKQTLNLCKLPPFYRYGDTGWATKKITIGNDVTAITWHDPQKAFVIASSRNVDFKLPEDDYHHEWANEKTEFLPQVEQSTLQLVDAKTWSIIDSYELDYAEIITSLATVNLEVSEVTKQRKDVIVIGTSLLRGEDLAAKGNVYVFDIVTTIPYANKPGASRRLKLIAREEVKGAVTAISEIGSQGFMLIAQGQKCVVRGMKEDGSIPPIAFIDVQTHVTVAKSLPGTGMTLIGDLIRGMWLVGYTEDPYRMIHLSKGPNNQAIVTGNLLPHDAQLNMVVIDSDTNLHVYQYDPEHPSSLSGQKLVHRSTFHTGHFPTSMTLLPSTLQSSVIEDNQGNPLPPTTSANSNAQPYNLLIANQTGVLSLLTPISESTYRRLLAVQSYLISQLEHACALNPKAYRAVESERFGSRGVLDGTVLTRWNELGSQRRSEVCAKLGVEEWVVRSDLEVIDGGGLGYL